MVTSVFVTVLPSEEIVPEEGSVNLFRRRRKLLLPDPDAPRMMMKSPWLIVRETSLKSVLSSNVSEIFIRSRIKRQ